jgi:hypothetical protein
METAGAIAIWIFGDAGAPLAVTGRQHTAMMQRSK